MSQRAEGSGPARGKEQGKNKEVQSLPEAFCCAIYEQKENFQSRVQEDHDQLEERQSKAGEWMKLLGGTGN